MVSFTNMGRCGNFLFQAAATIGYAHKHGVEFSVPEWTNNEVWNPTYLSHLVHPKFDPDLPRKVIEENRHNYYELEAPAGPGINTFLHGYWQSYKYFDFCRTEILELFNLPWHYDAGYVALHVRRGDYLRYPQINPLATRAYYEQAVRRFWLQGYKKFKVFSDDIPWCIEEFKHGCYQGCEFTYSQGKGVIEDICLMSNCEHTIMSNSTFAWWGAWLNRNSKKQVMCVHENNYYGPQNKHLDVSTLYPPEWTRLNY